MSSRRLALLLVLPLLASLPLLLGAPAAGTPPPEQVCGTCGAAFEDAAAANGVSLTVERSTATVAVHENGSATWTVRNAVGSADADRLQSNGAAERVVADLRRADDPVAVTVSGDGVVTIRYRVDDFAERSVGGAMRVEYFREDFEVANYDSLGADRLTVVAPEGMRVGKALPSASVEGREMTLTSYEPGVDSAFVTFVPRGSLLGPLLSLLAVAEVLVGVAGRHLLVDVLPPLAVFGVGVAGAVAVLSRFRARFERIRRFAVPALVALGGLGILATVVSVVLPVGGGPWTQAFGAGVGLLALGGALSRLGRAESVSYPTLAGLALAALAASLVAVLAAAAAFKGSGRLAVPLFLFAPLFGLLPAGAALGRGNRPLAVATALAAFLVGALAVVPLTVRPMGVSGVFPIVGGMYAAALALLGWPLLAVGASLAGERTAKNGT
jgi:hypothetical protein